MPRIVHEHEQEIRRAIRDAYAVDPIITQKKLLEFLEKRFNKPFGHQYISRLVKKVNGEVMPNLDREKIEPRLKEMRELFRVGRENLSQIAFDTKNSTPAERISAWRSIGLLQKIQLDAELDLGIYNKATPATDPDAFRYRELPAEVAEMIFGTFRRWKLPADLMRKIGPPVSIPASALEVKPVPVSEQNVRSITTTQPASPSRIGPTPDPELGSTS